LKSLRNKAHKLWSEIVRATYPVCMICGERPSTQAHHLLSKRHFSSLRFSPRVGRGVCNADHLRVHASPIIQMQAVSIDEALALIRLGAETERFTWNRARLSLVIVGLEELRNQQINANKEVAA